MDYLVFWPVALVAKATFSRGVAGLGGPAAAGRDRRLPTDTVDRGLGVLINTVFATRAQTSYDTNPPAPPQFEEPVV